MAGLARNGRVTDAPDRAGWSAFVEAHPKGSIFHTPEMHDVHARTRRYHPVTLAAVRNDGEIEALVSAVRVATLPPALGPVASRSVHYAEPLCRPGAEHALAAALREHDRRMRNRTLFTEVRPLLAPGGERAPLEAQGYRWEPYLNYVVDLDRTTDEIWAGFTQSARREVRRSVKAGVTIAQHDGPEGVEALHRLCRDVYRRARVPLADVSLFHAARDVLLPRDMLITFTAIHEGAVVGAHTVLRFGRAIVAWYWANVRVKGLFVQEQLVWHSLQWAAERGYTSFDMGGAGRPDEVYGVRDFKRKFGGEEVCFGRYRRVWSDRRLALAEAVYDLTRNRDGFAGRLLGWRGGDGAAASGEPSSRRPRGRG